MSAMVVLRRQDFENPLDLHLLPAAVREQLFVDGKVLHAKRHLVGRNELVIGAKEESGERLYFCGTNKAATNEAIADAKRRGTADENICFYSLGIDLFPVLEAMVVDELIRQHLSLPSASRIIDAVCNRAHTSSYAVEEAIRRLTVAAS